MSAVSPHESVRLAYEQCGDRLWRAVRAFSGSRDVADEAVAEAFAQALRRGDELRDPEAWVWRSAFLIAKGELARRRMSRPSGAMAIEPVDADDPDFHQLDVLLALDEADREILVLRYLSGYAPREIAQAMGLSPGAIRVRLHRARRRARSLLSEGDIHE